MDAFRRGLALSGLLTGLTFLSTLGLQGCELSDSKGGSGEVEVIVDGLGMVHIYADTDEELMWAAGYQMASDRLAQMDLVRRRALGRRAEIQGESRLEDDMLMRVFDFAELGRRDAARIEADAPNEYALLVAWVAGVNARLEDVSTGEAPMPFALGAEGYDYMPEPWTVEEVFATAKLFMFGNSNSLEFDFLATVLQTLNPDAFEAIEVVRPSDPAFILPPEDRPGAGNRELPSRATQLLSPEAAARRERSRAMMLADPELPAKLARFAGFLKDQGVSGSNNWALRGELTQSGRPIIANDPHQPIDSPSVLYALHLDSKSRGKGSFNVGGFAFAGTPGVQLGHNEHIHWAATTAFADVMDLWNVQRDGESIVLGGESLGLTSRVETIEVAGASPVELEVWEVEGGGVLLPDFIFDSFGLPKVLFTGDASREVMLNWAGFRETTEIIAFLSASRAETVDDYREAVKKMAVGSFNWMVADAEDIMYTPYMLVPDRGDPAGRQMPYVMMDGDDPTTLWDRGFLPDEKLPFSRGEGRGWIASANNDPFGFTADGDVSNDPWYYGALFAPGFRAARIDTRMNELVAAGPVTLAQMQALQIDAHPAYADTLLPHLQSAWAAAGEPGADAELAAFAEDDRLGLLVDALEGWDRQMTRDSSEAVVFHLWSHLLATDVTSDELGLAFDAVFAAQPGYPIKVAASAYNGTLAASDEIIGADGRDYLALRALEKAADWLEAEFGGVELSRYTWGDRHGTLFDNQLPEVDQGFVPTRGGDHTVDVSDSPFFDQASASRRIATRWAASQGAVFRFVTTFDDDGQPTALVNYAPGNSEEPDSPRFSNTLQDWLDGVYVPMPFTRAQVEAAEVERLTLPPRE